MSNDPYETLMYEDELPEDITDEEYSDWYEQSAVYSGVRMGPKWCPWPYWAKQMDEAMDKLGFTWQWCLIARLQARIAEMEGKEKE